MNPSKGDSFNANKYGWWSQEHTVAAQHTQQTDVVPIGFTQEYRILFDDITLERSAIEVRSEALSLAAHEFKTPLAIIKGCATTLLGGSARWDPAMQREMLQMIDTQSDRLYEVLNTLLDVWRLDAGAQTLHLSQVHLPELLRQMVERWQHLAPGHIFVLNIPATVPVVVCDVVRVEQALQAL